MNTPSHAIVNLAILMQPSPTVASAAVVGAILPDVPMFILYGWAKGVRRQSERQIWDETYWLPFWQNFNHTFHSIPLKLAAIALCYWMDWSWGLWLFVSMLLHSLGDLPIHNHDAHRHFFPLSNYRLISPFSYWDPRHYGRQVALVEKGVVLMATVYLFGQIASWEIQGVMLLVNVLYWTGSFYRLVFKRCDGLQANV